MARPSPTMPPVFRTPAARRFEELEVRIGVLERLQGLLQSKSQEESHTATTVTARWHGNSVYLTPREAAELATQERRNLHRASEHLSTVVNRLRDLFRDGRAWRAADMADMAESARTGEECSVTTFQASLLSLLRDLCRQAQVLMKTPTTKHYREFVSMLAASTVNLSGKGAD
jgi:transposase